MCGGGGASVIGSGAGVYCENLDDFSDDNDFNNYL